MKAVKATIQILYYSVRRFKNTLKSACMHVKKKEKKTNFGCRRGDKNVVNNGQFDPKLFLFVWM